MTIRFDCHQCGVSIKAPEQRAGAQLPCPKCGTQLTVPAAEPESATENEAAQFAHLVSKLESEPAPPPDPAPAPAPAQPPSKAHPTPEAEPELQDDRQGETSAVPPPSPKIAYEPAGKGQVRIVDIKLPFASVLRLGLQFWAVGLLASVALWIIFAIVALVLGALGMGLSLLSFQ